MDLDPKTESRRATAPSHAIDATTSDARAGHEPSQPDASRDAFIRGMRHVAASVTVVTTDGLAGRHGATVSAFCSVSADPPTVLVCLRNGSRISESVRRNGAFTVSVLSDDDQKTARTFCGEFDAVRPNRFEGVAIDEYPGLAPGIAGATTFVCKLVSAQEQCSHVICVGEVVHIGTAGRSPLTYLDGAYHSLRRDAARTHPTRHLESA